MLLNIFTVFILLKVGLVFYRVKITNPVLLQLIIISATVFLIQLYGEFLFSKFIAGSYNKQYSNYYFLSINQLYTYITGFTIHNVEYAFDTINLFEVFFWGFLIYYLAKMADISPRIATKIVVIFYVFPLLTFIFLISLLALLI